MANNFGLGRGLASLIPPKNKKEPARDNLSGDPDGENTEEKLDHSVTLGAAKESSGGSAGEENNNINEIDIARIVPNPHQPRKDFNQEKIQELADSIKQHGIIQPLVLTKNENHYEIIAGERRLQAAKMAGLVKIPAIVRNATEQQKLELAIIENIQRHDLNPVEEAKSYLKLVQEFGLKQEEVAVKVGKSRSSVANKLRILGLPIEIQKALIEGRITEGHAKAILALANPEKQRALFELIIKSGLTVRQVENKIREVSVRTHKRTLSQDPEIKKIEENLVAKLGTKVKVSKSGSGGRIIIDYYSKEELENLISKIC